MRVYKWEGRGWEREKSELDFLNPYSTSQKTSSDKDGPLSANKAGASSFPVFPSVSKYKSDSKEQHTKEEGIAKWIGRTGLLVTTTEDQDFVLMRETVEYILLFRKSRPNLGLL